MNSIEQQLITGFESLRPVWIEKITSRLASTPEVRESFQAQLDDFFAALLGGLSQGDVACLDSILEVWVEARPETDLEAVETSLPPILNQILVSTFDTARDALTPGDFTQLAGALLPVFSHALEYAARRETEVRFQYIARELEATQQVLEKLDQSKSDFIAIAAHELKTPLTLIEGYTAMMREQLAAIDRRLDNGRSAALEQIPLLLTGVKNGTRRLREIVDDMIDVSMIDNNLLSLHFQPLWINRILKMIQHEFEGIVHERRQTLDIRAFPGSDEMTFGDDERLYQSLRNLISNAIKYTPDGGRIRVDGRKLPGFVEITIADTGIGIAPEDHSRIFEKFGRVGSVSLHSSGKTKFKGGGPGLGLPIAKGIIEAHGGAIWVESEGYDEKRCPGTIFHILLPLRREPPDDKTAKLFGHLVESESTETSQTTE